MNPVISIYDIQQAASRLVGCAYTDMKLTVEPGGAVGLAALLNGAIEVSGKTVVVILSGANIDLSLFIELQKSR